MNAAISIRPPGVSISGNRTAVLQVSKDFAMQIMSARVKADVSAAVNTGVNIHTPVARDSTADIYDGEYIAIPKAHDKTVFPTQNKLLLENVTVMEVPYYETSNQSGTTVYIANEVI